ncbi:exonuclease domain-containing protein [Aquibacillus albus]|uniref:Inhibitor of KinA sporulation pathway (Predicted exonuclease) n=1 Tax=Aquibacillus albus TaxID=1168171 RepID=A0ABS2N2L9_9BACI|nr:inhibitor of KinA sporulation pathway (predicted exonuclease) [Aquibacillus albus]
MAETKFYVFFDFEMLCSNRGMPYEDMEAIRLGAVKYHIETRKISYFDQFIRPTNLRPLNKFCKKLTGIEDADLVCANDFSEVFSSFLTWVGGVKKARFFSWSKSDLSRLKLDANKHQVPNSTIMKIEKRYVDFQAVLSKRVSKDNLSVENALNLYGLTFVGQPHNPMYDAYNTLRVYLSFLHDPIQSDLIMLQKFVFGKKLTNRSAVNAMLRKSLKKDMKRLVSELEEIYSLKQVVKEMKRVRRLVVKYENITINRSGLFSDDIIENVQLLKEFYKDLNSTYKDHFKHSSKVMILDEYTIQPIKQIAM